MTSPSSERQPRRRFLQTAGGAGGAAAVGLLVAACGGGKEKSSSSSGGGSSSSGGGSSDAGPALPPVAPFKVPPRFGGGDLGIVNFALTLEYLETAFYVALSGSGLLKGAELATVRAFGHEEASHVKALTSAAKSLGKPAAKPTFDFSSALKSRTKALTAAARLENLGAAAYLGAAPHLKSGDLLASLLSIHSVEGRHAAALQQILGKNPTPDGPFGKPTGPAHVLKATKPFIKG